MKRHTMIRNCVMLAVLLLAASCGSDGGDGDAGPEAEVEAIRAVRLASNEAIEAQDAAAVAGSWTDDIQVTISSGTHLDGKDTYRSAFEGVFENTPGTVFVRTPETVEVADDGTIASERGTWTGTYPDQDITSRTGTYLAYWRKVDGRWLISAELYVPLTES